jgi:hypothetical protein
MNSRRALLVVVSGVLLAFAARAEDAVHLGLGGGVGALPVGVPNVLAGGRFDVELDRQFTGFAAVSLTSMLSPEDVLAVPSVEAGFRLHLPHQLAVGVAGCVGLALLSLPGSVARPVVGVSLEPIRWTLAGHHELGLRVALLFPVSPVPEPVTGPLFSVLLLPSVSWTYRF